MLSNLSRPLAVRCRGIGLTELLVSVCIIVILIACLFPMWKSNLQRAGTAKCAGNLRQFGFAVQARAAEYGDIPPYKDWTGSGGIWRTALIPYLPVNRNLEICPAEREPYKGDYQGNFFAHYGWSYGATPPSAAKKIGMIQSLSKLFLISDTTGSWYVTPRARAKLTIDKEYNFTFRHNGFVNVMFADGHVETLRPEDIPTTTESSTRKFKEFWDGKVD